MELLRDLVNRFFPDAIFYVLTIAVLLVGLIKCSLPILRNATSLKRAAETLEEGAKAKLLRPVWNEPAFLGKSLQPVWRNFLQAVDLSASRGISCDVAEYIHEETIIDAPGKSSLASIIPGICTSLGILGTFVGLSMGIYNLEFTEMDSFAQLTSGISLAFNTSIVGIIASLAFSIINRAVSGNAQDSIQTFTSAFYAYAIPQPPDTGIRLLSYERDQADALGQFAEDISVRMAGEIQHAISTAMAPMQRSMEDYLNVATRAQVDGLDYIVARFIDRMNASLDGQLKRLGQAISETADGQLKANEDLRTAVVAIGQITVDVREVHRTSEQVIAQFRKYVNDLQQAYSQVNDTQAETADLLVEMNEASVRQAKYLSALQEYQAKLQGSFQDYSLWTDRFVSGLQERTTEQNESLEQITMEMRASSDLLRGAYKSFVESIELGLANALGLFDENMQNLTRQIHSTLSDIQETMLSLEGAMERAAKAYTSEREVS